MSLENRFQSPAVIELTDEEFSRFAQLVESELGIRVPANKAHMLEGRLARRLRDLDIPSAAEYWEYLSNSPHGEEELTHFIDAVTTNKTDFFREAQHFEYLTNTALPEIPRNHPGSKSRQLFWCAGCSSGEEPYTLAMVLSEYALKAPGFKFSILATDVSTRMLEHAQSGIYREELILSIPPALRKRYLRRSKDPEKGLVRVTPELRACISFHRLNFKQPHYRVREMFDAIFFRNVMIYFDKATQEEIVNKLCRNLRPGGYLFIGHSESLTSLQVPVKQVAPAVLRKPLAGEDVK